MANEVRQADINRRTSETSVSVSLDLDGKGQADIETGIGFLDHMLTLFCVHSRFDLSVHCDGDTEVDDHHSTEDIGIALGAALREALGDKRGVTRYGSITLPMDEALVLCAVDLSGRAYLAHDLGALPDKVGTFDTELAHEFWQSVVRQAGITLHIKKLAGENTHHIIEASFKAAGRALRAAVSIDPELRGAVPSSKGSL